jgi:cytochrome c biogenesis protein ResB
MQEIRLRRPTWSEIYRFLGSHLFSYISLVSVLALFAMWIIPFQIYGVPGWRVQNMANELWFFRVSYFLVLLNLVMCMFQLFVGLRKRRKTTVPLIHTPQELAQQANYLCTEVAESSDSLNRMLMTQLRHKGYKLIPKDSEVKANKLQPEVADNIICTATYAVKGSRWGTLVFHFSLLPIILGVFVSLGASFYGMAVVTEGQSFSAQEDNYSSPSQGQLEKLRNRIPNFSFKLERINPVFWENKLLFTDLSAEVAYPAETQEHYSEIKLNSPLFVNGTFLELAGFGYSPYFILKNKDGKTIGESYVNLSIFPSGAEDYFQVPGLPYEIHVILWSDHVVEDGKPNSKSYNLINPLYTVYVLKDKNPGQIPSESAPPQGSPENKQLVTKGDFKPGQEIRFDGYTLTLPDIRYYGQFRVIYDPGLIFVFGGFMMMVLGICWRYFLYRRQVWAIIETTSSGALLHLAGTSDYFRESFTEELENLRERVLGRGGMGR